MNTAVSHSVASVVLDCTLRAPLRVQARLRRLGMTAERTQSPDAIVLPMRQRVWSARVQSHRLDRAEGCSGWEAGIDTAAEPDAPLRPRMAVDPALAHRRKETSIPDEAWQRRKRSGERIHQHPDALDARPTGYDKQG